MKILPLQTAPPNSALSRRHSQSNAAFGLFRNCLRWDFGFTCCACLLHEADVKEAGVEGFGVTSIEHYEPQSSSSGRANEYDNCLYVCRLCNIARSNRPTVDPTGRRLLNTTLVPWSQHFALHGPEFTPNGVDAEYTEEAYDINEPRKRVLRENRQKALAWSLGVLQDHPERIERLNTAAEADLLSDDLAVVARGREALKLSQALVQDVEFACGTAKRWSAIPNDAPVRCRCGTRDRTLPTEIDRQTQEIVC